MINPYILLGVLVNEPNASQIQFYRSVLLQPYPLVQGFSERGGGVSSAPLDSLNMGSNVGDSPENVLENHERLCHALGISRSNVVSVHQVHGNHVVRVGKDEAGTIVTDADAMITADIGVFMLMRFADCVPILFYDPRKHVAGIAHAGWRGTAIGVAKCTVEALQQEFDCKPADLVVVIGPSIGPCCYEVGSEVVEAMKANPAIPEHVIVQQPNDKVHADLWQANAAQLDHAGVQHVEIAGICTACHSDRFFSHRASGGHSGRFAAVIGLKGA